MRLISLSLDRLRVFTFGLIALSLLMTACGDNATTQPTAAASVAVTTNAISGTTATTANSSTNPTTSSTTSAAGNVSSNGAGSKTKVVFWSNQRHDQPLMNAQIDQFNRENADNLEIDYKVFTDDYPNLLQLAFQSNQGPDIFITRSLENMPSMIKAGYVESLDNYLTPEIKDRIGQVNFSEGMTVFNGKFYSLPTFASTFRLIYNKDLFKKAGLSNPPTTLTELVEDAKKLTQVGKAEGAYGFAINLKTPSNAWNRTLSPVTTRSGFRDYDYKTGQYNFAVDKPVLQAFRQIVTDGSMFPSYRSLDIDPLRSQFADGKIGMYMSVSAEVGVYVNQFTPKIEWAAAPVPTVDSPAKSGSLLGRTDWLAMSGRSKNKAAAWKVMQWFYRPEFLTKYQEEGYGNLVLPGLSKSAKTPTAPGSTYFLPDFKNADAVWPLPPTVSKIEGKDFSAMFAEYVFGLTPDLDTMLSDLTARYNKALARDVSSGTIQKLVLPDFDPAQLKAK